jgi:hypothetical protein
MYKAIHDETSLVIIKWVSPPTRHLMKLSLCEAASKGNEQVWCREVNCFKCTINPNSHAQIPGFFSDWEDAGVDERHRMKLRIPFGVV